MTKPKDQFPRGIPPSADQKRVQALQSPTNVENVETIPLLSEVANLIEAE